MIFKFTPPVRYDLTQIILGESSTSTGVLVPVASSVSIGSFPNWISTYDYSASSGEYYYAVKWQYTNGGYSDWSSPLMRGRTGIETNYILVNAPSVSSVYLLNPVSGDVATTSNAWLYYNQEYTLTINKELSGCLTYPLGTDYVLHFTSAYCPLFVSVNDIRYEVGDYINNLTDDTINRIIHKNSKYITNKYIEFTGAYPSNYSCSGLLMAEAFRRYVLCKTALDSIVAIQLSTGGKTSKKIGDVEFSYGATNAKSDPVNKKQDLKECIDSSLNVIFSGYSFQIGVRGRYFDRIKHPMYDSSYGRLSPVDTDYTHNMHSTFDEVIEENIGTVIVSSTGVV